MFELKTGPYLIHPLIPYSRWYYMSRAIKNLAVQLVRSSLQPQWLPEYKNAYSNSEVLSIRLIRKVTPDESIVMTRS